jgi:hypothetical protein
MNPYNHHRPRALPEAVWGALATGIRLIVIGQRRGQRIDLYTGAFLCERVTRTGSAITIATTTGPVGHHETVRSDSTHRRQSYFRFVNLTRAVLSSCLASTRRAINIDALATETRNRETVRWRSNGRDRQCQSDNHHQISYHYVPPVIQNHWIV